MGGGYSVWKLNITPIPVCYKALKSLPVDFEDIDMVDFNFRKPGIITRLFGIGGGTQEVITQRIDGITIDKHDLRYIEVEFGNLQSNIGINGFLGNDILSSFIVTIDYVHQEIMFDK